MIRPLALVLLMGCGTTATISRNSGRDIEGRVLGGDDDHVYVKGAGGKPLQVSRDDITEVNHPGNVLAAIGGINAGLGLLGAFVGGYCLPVRDSRGREEVRAGPCAVAALDILLGITMVAVGATNYVRSEEAFDSTDGFDWPPARTRPAPAPLPEPEKPAENVGPETQPNGAP